MNEKCVMIINADLPLGLIANTAAVLSLTIGSKVESIIGPDIYDGSGAKHVGITTTPIPILKSNADEIKRLREEAANLDHLFVVDFSDVAQATKTYDEYTQKIGSTQAPELTYLGIAIYGHKKSVNKLTGNMPLLR